MVFPYLDQNEPIPICMVANLVDINLFITDSTGDITHTSPRIENLEASL